MVIVDPTSAPAQLCVKLNEVPTGSWDVHMSFYKTPGGSVVVQEGPGVYNMCKEYGPRMILAEDRVSNLIVSNSISLLLVVVLAVGYVRLHKEHVSLLKRRRR